VLRGASWNNNNPDNLLSSNRNNNAPDNRKNNIGFRCVLAGGSAPRWQTQPRIGEMPGGLTACPAGAKTSPKVVEPLAESEPVAFGQAGAPVKGPASEFSQGRVYGRPLL